MDVANSSSGWGGFHVNEYDGGTSTNKGELSMNVDGARKVFAQGLSANTDATLTFDLSGIKAERFEGYVGIDYTKSTKTNRDGANFIFYKDSISEENKLAESGVILQPDNAKLMNVDLTGVEKLIIYIDKVGGKNDDCVDIADAKVYVKEDDNTPDQPSKDELEEIKNQAVAAKNDAETAAKAAEAAKDSVSAQKGLAEAAAGAAKASADAAKAAQANAEAAAKAAEEAQKKAEEILAKAQKEAEEKRAEAQKQLEEVQAMQKRLESQLAKTEFAAKKVKVKAVKGVKKSVKVNWKSVEGADGYVIEYAKKANFKGKKTVTVSASRKAKTIKRLSAKKTYYVRVKVYKVVDNEKVYTAYSAKKKVRTK